MNRTQANSYIKEHISLIDYLKPAANHHGNTGYCCPNPNCNSGHGGALGHDGAVEYFPKTNSWYCYSCKAGGDIFNFYRYQTGATYTEALQDLAKAAGIELEKEYTPNRKKAKTATKVKKHQEHREPAESQESENTEPQNYVDYYIKCCDNLEQHREAVEYLKKRGISLTTARRLLIGFDPEADPANAPGAIEQIYKPYPTPRIIAPCNSYFYINRRTDGGSEYKKVNPAGSSAHVFNESAIYSNRTNYCFIVEGFFDALAIEEHGHEAAALNSAGNGDLLIEQLKTRPAHNKKYIICFDRDTNPDTRAKVEKEAAELAEELTHLNYKAITFDICGNAGDPNDAAIQSPADFEKVLTEAEASTERDELDDFIEKIQTTAYKPINSGLDFFDELTGGTMNQTLTVILGEPGSGKSMLSQQLAESYATHGQKCIYLNFEMSKEQLLARAISARVHARGNVNRTARQILQGYKWTQKDRQEITAAVDEYRRESLPNIAYNPAAVTPDLDDIIEYLHTLIEQENSPALFVDYLQLIQSERLQDIKDRLTAALIALKEYAIKAHTFVYLIAAVNRTSNGNITQASARDTSAIEYQADTILSIANAKDQEATQGRQHMTLKVLKGRDGDATGNYSNVYRDGANSTFYGQYKGAEPDELPGWLTEDSQEEIYL